MIRPVKFVYKARNQPIENLITYQALPNPYLENIDPFLLLNHHGPQVYEPKNRGLPFGPHPHRGFQTLTFILKGELVHQDNAGHKNIIKAGGIQWMNAGRGIIHSEVSSEEYKRKGGEIEVIQLWINLPSRLKMSEPKYVGLQACQVPSTEIESGVEVYLVSGQINGISGAIQMPIPVTLFRLRIQAEKTYTIQSQAGQNILCYCVQGKATINDVNVESNGITHFEEKAGSITLKATENAEFIMGLGLPFGEPIVSHGPFVMNSTEEIRQAIFDYQAGRFE